MGKRLAFVGIALLAISLAGQTTLAGDTHSLRHQVACEKKMLRSSGAKEILQGPEYEMFLNVATAFGRGNPPRLYFVRGGGNAVYVAGSVVDGRGKILISQTFVELMGNTSALEGVVAHEMAHLALDGGEVGCDDWVMRNQESEMEADALAASKVGFDPVRAFLFRVEELTGIRDMEAASRLQALEKLEAQRSRQR
jgi:Zn-dependent protease with chaperone function